MLAEERRAQILLRLHESGHVRTSDLVQQFEVSDVTLRTDLQELERLGRLVRTRGGAVLSAVPRGKTTFSDRQMKNQPAKQRIAAAAAKYLRDEETVVFDAGTTMLALAHHIPPVSNLTVWTPGLNVAQQLMNVDGVNVMVIGGQVDPDTVSTMWSSPLAGEQVPAAHMTFLGAHGIDGDLDIVDVSIQAAAAKRRLVEAGRRVTLLADSSKWSVAAPSKVVGLSDVDVVITDTGIAKPVLSRLRDVVPEVIVV